MPERCGIHDRCVSDRVLLVSGVRCQVPVAVRGTHDGDRAGGEPDRRQHPGERVERLDAEDHVRDEVQRLGDDERDAHPAGDDAPQGGTEQDHADDVAMEMTVISSVRPGRTLLVVNNGVYGARHPHPIIHA
ncbi:hypothetical protein AB0H83_29070 [Dactylosporangium sp. NPDC050688]|uniref:hypothetical protein n=1 Tax=Dactylosporangium sp. NPDC050688 TaxID=3157217 RepID=UPI0033EBDDDD